jgi:hypothetical protein
VPFFDNGIPFRETAVFWFGKITETENYSDVRVGFNNSELYVHVAVFDNRIWYDTSPKAADLTNWDAVTLLLDTDGPLGSALDDRSYRFSSQVRWHESEDNYKSAYRGSPAGWNPETLAFSAETTWRGTAPNDTNKNDRGWTVTFRIPFSSLNHTNPPATGKVWGLAVIVHDRDVENGPVNPDKVWPSQQNPTRPGTWGRISFGLPTYNTPNASSSETVVIRQGLDGARVVDGEVGGGNNCGKDLDWWTEWGNQAQPGSEVSARTVFGWPDKRYVRLRGGRVPRTGCGY